MIKLKSKNLAGQNILNLMHFTSLNDGQEINFNVGDGYQDVTKVYGIIHDGQAPQRGVLGVRFSDYIQLRSPSFSQYWSMLTNDIGGIKMLKWCKGIDINQEEEEQLTSQSFIVQLGKDSQLYTVFQVGLVLAYNLDCNSFAEYSFNANNYIYNKQHVNDVGVGGLNLINDFVTVKISMIDKAENMKVLKNFIKTISKWGRSFEIDFKDGVGAEYGLSAYGTSPYGGAEIDNYIDCEVLSCNFSSENSDITESCELNIKIKKSDFIKKMKARGGV